MKFSLAILSAVLLVTNNVVITTANEVDDLIESEQEIIAKLNGLQMKSHLDSTTTTTTMTTATKAAAAQEDTHETKRQFHKEEKKLAKAQKLNEEMNLMASTIVDADGSNDDEVVGIHSHHHIDAKADKNTFTIEDKTIKVAKTSKAKVVESTSKASKATKAAKAHGDSIVLASNVHSLSMSHSMSMAAVTSTSTTSESATSLHAKATKATKDLIAKASKTTTSETTTTTSIANTTQALSLSYSEVASTPEDTLASKSAKAAAETKPTKPVLIEYTEKPEVEEVEEEDSSASEEVPEVEVVDVDEEEEEEVDTKSTSEEDQDEEKEEDSEEEEEEEEEGSEDSDSDESEQVTRGSDPELIKEVQNVMLNGIASNNHMNKPDTMNPRTELNGKVMAAVDLSSDSSTIRGGMIVGGVCLFVSSFAYAMII